VTRDEKRAREAGLRYADDQLASDQLHHWIWEDLREGQEMEERDPSSIAPGFETKNLARDKRAAMRLAKNMLEQIRWDISRDISDSDVKPYLDAAGVEGRMSRALRDAFSNAVREVLSGDAAETWLAEEYIMPIAKGMLG